VGGPGQARQIRETTRSVKSLWMDSRWRCCGFRFPPDVIVLAVDEPATRRLAVALAGLALAI
jgi:hypothetical protein